MHEFPVSGPIRASITISAGDVTVTAEERDTATVTVEPYDSGGAAREAVEQTRVTFDDGELRVETPQSGWIWRRGWRVRVHARIPFDSELRVSAGAADTRANGRYSTAQVALASGDLILDDVTGAANITTASGDVHVGTVGGDLQVQSAAGDARVGAVGGDALLHSASGHLRVGTLAGSVTARSAAGDIELRETRQGELRLYSASGDIAIGVAPGTALRLDLNTLSGRTHSDLPVGDTPPTGRGTDLEINARSLSGNVSVFRAAAPKVSTEKAA
ncbi:hypothetical protein Val02_27720 [Virgisporangium aliadipatigenens]|uniref:DUF4097 domain-containing protein n=1 Tax=Virgisporangium aliadipatigenens TaxID=741659 RepID=A0A8J3YIT6_9ACTN|nr:DUF4097 family beta strand repeat-containing protein [Virgisporangium aliadipatigenens]GIJ45886.1 hypothetical protein Val02_27720 [Virgisporangium aliadipatigenens]